MNLADFTDKAKTAAYYEALSYGELCDCADCRLYYAKVRGAYPELSARLDSLGIDIAKPHESMAVELPESGETLYIGVQYVALGRTPGAFAEKIEGVSITPADAYPDPGLSEDFFVLELDSLRLPRD